jgi:hypothetical protein
MLLSHLRRCCSFLKDYGKLLPGDGIGEKARSFAGKVKI